MPPMVIADLGAGEGTISQLMAQRAKRVIAVDNSEKMVEFGAELARKHGIANLEYRLGDLEDVPIRTATVDLAFLSQALHHAPHPDRAMAEAWRILKPGGRIAILDLNRHHFEEAREMYADLWLGFTEPEIDRFLKRGRLQERRDGGGVSGAGAAVFRNGVGDRREAERVVKGRPLRDPRGPRPRRHGRGLPSLRPPPRAEDVGGLRLRSVGGPGRRLKAG